MAHDYTTSDVVQPDLVSTIGQHQRDQHALESLRLEGYKTCEVIRGGGRKSLIVITPPGKGSSFEVAPEWHPTVSQQDRRYDAQTHAIEARTEAIEARTYQSDLPSRAELFRALQQESMTQAAWGSAMELLGW